MTTAVQGSCTGETVLARRVVFNGPQIRPGVDGGGLTALVELLVSWPQDRGPITPTHPPTPETHPLLRRIPCGLLAICQGELLVASVRARSGPPSVCIAHVVNTYFEDVA